MAEPAGEGARGSVGRGGGQRGACARRPLPLARRPPPLPPSPEESRRGPRAGWQLGRDRPGLLGRPSAAPSAGAGPSWEPRRGGAGGCPRGAPWDPLPRRPRGPLERPLRSATPPGSGGFWAGRVRAPLPTLEAKWRSLLAWAETTKALPVPSPPPRPGKGRALTLSW